MQPLTTKTKWLIAFAFVFAAAAAPVVIYSLTKPAYIRLTDRVSLLRDDYSDGYVLLRNFSAVPRAKDSPPGGSVELRGVTRYELQNSLLFGNSRVQGHERYFILDVKDLDANVQQFTDRAEWVASLNAHGI